MASESKELAFVPAREKAMAVFTTDNALDPYLAHVRAEIDAFKPDLTTKKGRDAIASMAYKVAQSKVALETLGKSLADEAKEIPKKIDASRKAMKETLDAWRDEVRKPLDDWEAEQKRLEEIKLAEEAAKALAIKIDNDHEVGLLLNEKFDRERAEALDLAEQQRIEYEARIAENAAELARQVLLARQEQEGRDYQLAIERAQREKAEAEARERQAIIDAQAREIAQQQAAELATRLAAEQAERNRLQAIEDGRARVVAENKRLADIRAAEELQAQKAAANKAHQKRINNEALDDLIEIGCTKELATAIVVALAKKTIRNCSINY